MGYVMGGKVYMFLWGAQGNGILGGNLDVLVITPLKTSSKDLKLN